MNAIVQASTRHLIWTLGISAVVLLPVFLVGTPRWRPGLENPNRVARVSYHTL